jgi:hypothetical protein
MSGAGGHRKSCGLEFIMLHNIRDGFFAWRLMKLGGSGSTTLNKVWSVEFFGDDFSAFRLT